VEDMSRDDRGTSALGGLLLGAIGGAMAVILMDPAKRQKLRNTLDDWVSTGQDKVEEMQGQLEDATLKGRRQLARKIDPDKNDE
jgi:gas vesicle protein